MDHDVAAGAMIEAGCVEEKLAALVGRVEPYFSRLEPLRQVSKYVRGLMSDLPRKNLLEPGASWNTFVVMRAVRDFVVEHLADPDEVMVTRFRPLVSQRQSHHVVTPGHPVAS
jgi:hypothetical protein